MGLGEWLRVVRLSLAVGLGDKGRNRLPLHPPSDYSVSWGG